LTCEYCFSHYVTAFVVYVTGYTLLFDDWRGFFVAGVFAGLGDTREEIAHTLIAERVLPLEV
jgi:hypothetical protein